MWAQFWHIDFTSACANPLFTLLHTKCQSKIRQSTGEPPKTILPVLEGRGRGGNIIAHVFAYGWNELHRWHKATALLVHVCICDMLLSFYMHQSKLWQKWRNVRFEIRSTAWDKTCNILLVRLLGGLRNEVEIPIGAQSDRCPPSWLWPCICWFLPRCMECSRGI